MRIVRHPAGWLISLAFLVPVAGAQAQTPPSPLRLVPDQADLAVQVENPRKLVETFTTLDLVKQLQGLDVFREFYDSTNYRRFFQLVAHFEKELGVPWPEALDRVAGGGAVVASKFGSNPAPALLVVQSKDEAALRKFVALALEVVEQELARQESKEKPEKSKYREVETIRLGNDFHAAVAGSALLVSNKEKSLHAALDLHVEKGKKCLASVKTVAQARKLLPKEPLASLWINMETVHKAPQAKEVFAMPRNDINVTVLFGGWLDVARRSKFVAAGLYRQKDGFLATVRMPSGREGASEELAPIVPAGEDTAPLPLLEPKGVLYSSSFYWDVGKYWELRKKLFNEAQVKTLEDFDKNSGRFLAGNQFNKLLTQVGPHHRLVVARQAPSTSASASPSPLIQAIPAVALVSEMRDHENLAKSLETILRGAALLAGTQLKMKLVEETHGKHTIIGYHFVENTNLANDPQGIRFRFSPCFVTVGNQFIASSTMPLCKELIDLLEQPSSASAKKPSKAVSVANFYAEGGAQMLRGIEDILLAQTILDQAATPEAAKKQVEALVEIVRHLGMLRIEQTYGAKDFRYDIKLKLGK